jgi:hypothetical protein
MTKILIRILAKASGGYDLACGQYLSKYDPNGYEGRGKFQTTPWPNEAMAFPDQEAAMRFWKQQSKVKPLRADGQPNRPLTAYTIEVVQHPNVEGVDAGA